MRFILDDEQRGFASSLSDLLGKADVVGATRAWAEGDTSRGLTLWSRLAEQGVTALAAPESAGGMGADPIDLVVAFEQLGRYAVPGPWIESAAYLPRLLADVRPETVSALAEGAVGSVHVADHAPCALDADVAEHLFVARADEVHTATVAGAARGSVDPARRLFDLSEGERVDAPPAAVAEAFDLAALACSAQLLGLGEHLLASTVDYVKQRKQFGRVIGSYQALKHGAADVRIILDFARPLVHGAALTFDTADRARDVSAAKVAVSDAAYRAARTALQLHGAIGYTEEYDLSLWLLKVRALVAAWGTTSFHRARVLDAVTGAA